MIYFVEIDRKTTKIDFNHDNGSIKIKIDDKPVQVDTINATADGVSFFLENRLFEVLTITNENEIQCWLGSKSVACKAVDEKTAKYSAIVGDNGSIKRHSSLIAPMPGLVITVEVNAGDHVKKGGGLVIMEAMKMENELRAAYDCVIKEIKIGPGQTVDKGQVLIVFDQEN
jgi:biotin carboxyl carrier protein